MKSCAQLFALFCLSLTAWSSASAGRGGDGLITASHRRRSVRYSRLSRGDGVLDSPDSGRPSAGRHRTSRKRRRLVDEEPMSHTSTDHADESSKLSDKSTKTAKSDKISKGSKSLKAHKSPKKRECKSSRGSTNVKLRCSAHEDDVKDEIHFDVSTGRDGVMITVRYKLDDKSNIHEDGTHTKVEEFYELFFSNVIEYLPDDSDGDLGFGWDGNEEVQSIDLSHWDPFSDVTKDEEGVLHFHVQTVDGIVRLDFKLSEEESERLMLSSNRIKIDVTLSDFPWQREDTLLALLSRLEADTDMHTHYHHSDDSGKGKKIGPKPKEKPMHPTDVQVSFDNGTLPFGEFIWVTTADVGSKKDGGEVVATSPQDDQIPDLEDVAVQYIAFSFLDSSDANYIYWDPEVGVAYRDESVDSPAAMAPSPLGSAFLARIGASGFGGYYALLYAASGMLFLLQSL